MAARDWTAPWQQGVAGKPALARAWATALAPYAPDGVGRPEVQLQLRRHLETLHDALLAEPPDVAAVERIGAALVEQGTADPAALAVTIRVLGDRLLAELGLDDATFRGSLHALLGALAGGFARALLAR